MIAHRSAFTSRMMAWPAWLGAVALCGVLGSSGTASAQSQSCGEVGLSDGRVTMGQSLTSEMPLSETTTACLSAVAKKLVERPLFRSVTVIVRMPDEQRKQGEALVVAQAMGKVLTDNGLPARKVSVVAPAVGHGQQSGVSLVYRENKSARAIARIDEIGGSVRGGPDARSMAPIAVGATLRAYDRLETDADSHAVVTLADKSRIIVKPSSQLVLGNISLTQDYKREVRIQVLAGSIETIVAKSEQGGTFEIVTRAAVAGVRGTNFRVSVEQGGSTRVETTEGEVWLGNAGGQASVPKGYGSRANEGAKPEDARPLLQGPRGLMPPEGIFAAAPLVEWKPVDGASSYVVEVARNAQFTREVSWRTSASNSLTLDSGLAPGRWFWRVSAVDGEGFVGMPSKIYGFLLDPASGGAATDGMQ